MPGVVSVQVHLWCRRCRYVGPWRFAGILGVVPHAEHGRVCPECGGDALDCYRAVPSRQGDLWQDEGIPLAG